MTRHSPARDTQFVWRTRDVLRTASGTARLLASVRQPGESRVYNLEVEAEHVYYVGAARLLVHNGCGVEPGKGGAASAANGVRQGPTEPYNRQKHYGKTPTAADRKAVGAGADEVADHQPALVERYYEGDPAIDEPPGYTMTDAERKASAADRARMSPQPRADSDAQGAAKSRYSREQKEKHGL